MKQKLADLHTFETTINQALPLKLLTRPTLDHLIDHSEIKTYKKNSNLWTKGEDAEFCSLLISGFVEITDTSRLGDERIYGLFGPQDVLGLSALIKKTQYPATAVVSSHQCTTINIYLKSAFTKLTGSAKDELQLWVQKKLIQHEEILRQKIIVLGSGSLYQKLIEMFDYLAQRFSDNKINTQNKIFIPTPLTKTHIAKFIGARVETVIRELNRWEKLGILIMTSEGIFISPIEPLRELNIKKQKCTITSYNHNT